jgi:predicted nucleic acid-binding Zn ribbon protein
LSNDRKSRPGKIGDALRDYLKNSGLEPRVEQAATIPNWKKLVGPQIAAVTEPISVSAGGVLFVAVKTSAWMSELSLMEPELLRSINKNKTSAPIKKIRFRLTR